MGFVPQILGSLPMVLVLLQLMFNKIFDLYRSYRSTRFAFEMTNIIKSNIAVFITLITISILTSTLFQFQIPVFFYFVLNTTFGGIYRFVLRKFLRMMRRKGYNKKTIVILGINDCTDRFLDKLVESTDLGYEILGYFDYKPNPDMNIPYLGKFAQLSQYYKKFHTDEALIMLSDKNQRSFLHLVAVCENWGVKFSIVPNMFSDISSRVYISSFDGIPVMSMRNVPLDNTLNQFIKRAGDILISILMLIFLSPLMAATAIIIKCTSPGKVIFRQERVGIGRNPFIMYKFRSMRTETESDISSAEKNDTRCTPFGHFIRRFSIDELPQLLNVLKGDMSLVGPRPEIPFYVKEYRKSVPLYMVKHYVKPGMTGWAQVNDLRGSDTSIPNRIKHDIYYIENWSVGLDIKILFKTLSKAIFSKNAR